MRRPAIAAATIAAVLLCLCGCKAAKKPSSETKELLLYCGAGIRPPVDELVQNFESVYGVKVITDYAGSEILYSKMKLSERGDLYMPGDRYYLEQAADRGMILYQRPICYFVPTILVQKGNPKAIRGLKDLLRSGLKIGLGDPNTCAVGRKTVEVFAKNNIAWADIEKNVAFLSMTVNELGMQIQARSLDAVIVWDAIARYYAEYGEEVPIPAENNIVSPVDVGVLVFSKDRDLAEKFVEFAASEQGRAVFKKHNYQTEAPE